MVFMTFAVLLFLAGTFWLLDAFGLFSQVKSVMHQSFIGMEMLHATLCYIGSFVMFGIDEALRKLERIAVNTAKK